MLSRFWRVGLALPRSLSVPPTRFVSQSKASSGTASTAVTDVHHPEPPAGHGGVSPYVKNPDYHGFSCDPVEDEWNMKVGFFFGISVALVIGGTFIYYLPDQGMRQWARREAEQLIQLREEQDLPLIKENYYDTSKIILPPSEKE
ncbi:NADH dehydrogenase [ubiquinone] 1 beta subcomplex subunit 11, mitochondrial [Fundulus heteroclitus]|nr:NADH dehydrogenase [ubiquinone] 1 beta subcomplex subunit 11, mitochondrial [Fundulus heteroclitus]